jgi:hypothetical protein
LILLARPERLELPTLGVDRPFDREEFPFVFLEAFGNKETTLNRLGKARRISRTSEEFSKPTTSTSLSPRRARSRKR